MSMIVDTTKVKATTEKKKNPAGGFSNDFAATMNAIAPGTSNAVAHNVGSKAASSTHLAITGVAGAPQAFGYGANYGSPAVPIGATTGGYQALNAATGGYPIPGAPASPTGTDPMGGGSDFLSQPSAAFQEASWLIKAGFDSNMVMLGLQSQVQDMNRQFTVLSNVLMSKHQTEINSARNLRIG